MWHVLSSSTILYTLNLFAAGEPLGQCRGEGLCGILHSEAGQDTVAAGTNQGMRWEGTAMTSLQ